MQNPQYSPNSEDLLNIDEELPEADERHFIILNQKGW